MNQPDESFLGLHGTRVAFPLTEWTVVRTAADLGAPAADAALDQLCRTYWRPVYHFIRQQGHGRHDALDRTQAFFAHLLEKQRFKHADPARGRFRSFLLTALKHFLADEWASTQAQKRGGGAATVSLDQPNAAGAFLLAQLVDPGASPDLAYEKEWALSIQAVAYSGLRQQCASRGESEPFDALANLAFGDAPAGAQAALATQLGMTPNALGVAVHRLRRRYGEVLRATIAQTANHPDEIEDELRHLIAVVSS